MAIAIVTVAVILALLGAGLLVWAALKGATAPFVPYIPWGQEMLNRWANSKPKASEPPPEDQTSR